MTNFKTSFDQYKINPNTFMNVKTPETSYVLGLLWADGSLTKHEVRIECIKSDIDKFYPTFIKTGNWNIFSRARPGRKPQSTIYTSNRPLSEYLASHSYESNNICSADIIINKIPAELRHYWFRGLIDGDGCWYINEKNHCYQFHLGGRYDQDWAFLKTILSKLDIKYSETKRISNKGHKDSIIRITGKSNLSKWGQYIYEGFPSDCIGLERKYNKYLEIVK